MKHPRRHDCEGRNKNREDRDTRRSHIVRLVYRKFNFHVLALYPRSEKPLTKQHSLLYVGLVKTLKFQRGNKTETEGLSRMIEMNGKTFVEERGRD